MQKIRDKKFQQIVPGENVCSQNAEMEKEESAAMVMK